MLKAGAFGLRLGRYWQARLTSDWKRLSQRGPENFRFWIVALVLGVAAGYAALGFRVLVSFMQEQLYGADDTTLASHAAQLPWVWIVILPILGGLFVGLLWHVASADHRAHSVADVIEGAALREGRVSLRAAWTSAVASLVTLSTGGSTGREGPVVHIGAAISTCLANIIKADGITARELLGCAAAAAVAASFNAPLAGAIFAHEVVLRHYAVHAFAPIAIASVSGAVVGRLHMGDVTEFAIPANMIAFYGELPAFMLLGIACGFVAVATMRAVFLAEDTATRTCERYRIPIWARPAFAGALLGILALGFPHIIGVGYETTSRALTGELTLAAAFTFAIVKVVATALTIGGRMGGGVFSPSLMIGALTGLAFGYVATAAVPEFSGSQTVYALAGMGALSAAVLGAPVSTTLIVFELTGDWQVGIAVMVSVSLATILSSRLVDRSYFLTQLERRNVHLAEGPQGYLLSTLTVSRLTMDTPAVDEAEDLQLIESGQWIQISATLETALPQLEASGRAFIPVVAGAGEEGRRGVGRLYLTDALRAYNEALVATAREEHA